jgi:hypothetical protein
MAFNAGKDAVFTFDDSTNTPRTFTAYLTNTALARTCEALETTTFGKAAKTYLPGLIDGTVSIEGYTDPTYEDYLTDMMGTMGDWTFSPQGTAGGSRKFMGTGFLTSLEITSPVDGVCSFTAELQISGDVTATTN